MSEYQPKIVGFLCKWCSYAGADLAGISRISYPSNICIICIPCSGRFDPLLVIKSFQMGADGVLICGCYPDECFNLHGNYYARRRFVLLKSLLEYLGIEKERFHLEWVSAADGKKFAKLVSSFVDELRKLGPRRY